jgi:hypothetical protein
MKKLIFLAASICFLSFPAKTQAVKKVLYSVKSSDSQLELSYDESVMQTFRCQPDIGGIDLKLSGPNDTHFVFRLKPNNAEDWYFEQEFKNISFANRVVYPIGFPPIEECGEDTWLFELKSLNQNDSLTAYYNSQDPYPEGEMFIADKQIEANKSDLTFRLSTNVSLLEQLKTDFIPEIRHKLIDQSLFWLFYFLLISAFGVIILKNKRKP